MIEESKLLRSALWYLRHGYSVIPLIAGDKLPQIKWADYMRRRATEEEVQKWWEDYPEANVGVVTGAISGLLVIDIDTDVGRGLVAPYLPKGLICPTTNTPRGGNHLYFKYPYGSGITIGARFLDGVDFRGDSGYVCAPPDRFGQKYYSWAEGLGLHQVAPAPLPPELLRILKEKQGTAFKPEAEPKGNIWEPGRRDEQLFHLALTLMRANTSPEYVRQILTPIVSSWGETNPAWIEEKINSAVSRLEKRGGMSFADLREWIDDTQGQFSAQDVYSAFQLTTRMEKQSVSKALQKLITEGTLERVGTINGRYRRRELQYEVMDYLNAPDTEYDLHLPLGLNRMCILYPGNVCVVGGTSNAGKTAFLLNIVRDNMHHKKIFYLNSEMGETELRIRLSLFEDLKLQDWHFIPIERSEGFADLITGEDAIWIVDYLDITDEFWKAATTIKEIHQKLGAGVAVIAMQKKSTEKYARGGEGTLEKARLYVTLDRDDESNIISIKKAKAWRNHDFNPNGKTLRYKLAQGHALIAEGKWA